MLLNNLVSTKKWAIVLIIVMTFTSFNMIAFAEQQKNGGTPLKGNIIEAKLEEMIKNDYRGLYELSNFEFKYSVREEGRVYLDIDVEADMMLIREPSKSPFIIGMKERLNDELDLENHKLLTSEIDLYVNDIKSYYLKPLRSTFPYTVVSGSNSDLTKILSIDDVSFFYRTNPADVVLLTDVNKLLEVENATSSLNSGYETADDFINKLVSQEMNTLNSSFIYDRIAARDWALDKYTKTPEYPSEHVGGTNCANFVSKALNAGGIPEDTTGEWYRASTWGGWPGDNWFRTGYHNNGGVVPYMTSKGYFYYQSNESSVYAGSIMYWNAQSHVALVTYGDTVTIKYTEQGAQQRADVVYRTEDVKFYMPESSIMN